jgi:hypothetical protein
MRKIPPSVSIYPVVNSKNENVAKKKTKSKREIEPREE